MPSIIGNAEAFDMAMWVVSDNVGALLTLTHFGAAQ